MAKKKECKPKYLFHVFHEERLFMGEVWAYSNLQAIKLIECRLGINLGKNAWAENTGAKFIPASGRKREKKEKPAQPQKPRQLTFIFFK